MSTIIVDTRIDLKSVQSDLKKAEREIEKFRDEVERKAKERESLISDRDIKGSLYERSMEDIRKEKALPFWQQNQAFIAEESKRAKQLWADYDKAAGSVERMDASLEASKNNLAESEKKAAGLRERLRDAYTHTGKLAEAGDAVEAAFQRTWRRIKMLARRALVFSVILKGLHGIKNYLGDALRQNNEAVESIGRLKGAFQTMAQPLINTLIPAVITLANWLNQVITAITMLLAKLTGKQLSDFQKSAKGMAKGAGGKGNKPLASFDTINKLSSGAGAGGAGGGGAGAIEAIHDAAMLTSKDLDEILRKVAFIGAGFAAWQLPFGGDISFFQKLVGILIFLWGLAIAVPDYLEAWDEGIDAENLTGILKGLTIAAIGLGIAFGPLGAAVGFIAMGISLLVLGFRDVTKHGANLHNVLTVIAGVVATGLGFAILTGSIIPLVIAAILGIVLAVVYLGGEFEALAEGVKTIFEGIIKFIKGVFTGDWQMAWEGVKEIFRGLWNSMLAIVGGVVNAMIKGLNWLISKINSSLRITIPDWIPGIGGKSWSPNIPAIPSWQVPYLARGAVIPPNREFMAILGDQKSGTNIETPLETMIAAFKAAQGSQKVVVEFRGDLAALGRVLNPVIRQEDQRLGLAQR